MLPGFRIPVTMSNGLTRVLLIIAIAAATSLIWFKGYDMFTGSETSIMEGIDDTGYFLWLRSAVIDRDLDFANDFEQTRTISAIHRDNILNGKQTEAGRIPDKYWIGWALLNAIPFGIVYLAAVFRGLEVTGFEPSFLIAIWAFQLLLGVFSLRFAYMLIRRYTSSEAALLGVLMVWLASPLVYYQTARLSLVHNQVFFLIAALYLLTFRIKDGRAGIWTWIVMGFVSGLAVVTRSTAVVYLLFPMVVAVGVIRDSNWKQWLPRSSLALAGAFVPVILQMGAWKSVY
jgi:4-amino-4-deoxy-L-arabinose transferase-like glycosyltransferase